MHRIATTLFMVFGLSFSAQASRLEAPLTIPVGSNPRGLASGDLNGDGFADVAVANFGSGTLIGQSSTAVGGSIQLFKGSAAGLQTWTELSSAKSPRSLVMGDLNADGLPDLAATFYDDGKLGVYLQQGDGSFVGPLMAATGVHPVGLALGSLNGSATLAVANYNSDSIGLYKVSGGGVSLIATHAVGANPTDVEFYSPEGAATQLLSANYGANSLSRLSLGSDGSLQNRTDTPVSGQPCKVVVADVNGDGYLDASVAQFSENKVSLFLGAAGGVLGATASTAGLQGQHPNGLAWGALGATGRLVAADRDSDQVDLLAWTPQGLSSTAALVAADANGNTVGGYGPIEASVADVNGDGLADLLVTHMRSNGLKLYLQKPLAAPLVSSSTHPDPAKWFASTEAVLQWEAPADMDGIAHYLAVFDQVAATQPQEGQGVTQEKTASFGGLASGQYYLHVRGVDAAGRLGEVAHFKVGVTAALSKENVYNYPNPSRDGHTSIRFPLLAPAEVSIKIYDEVGSLVWSRDLGANETIVGVNVVAWDGRNGNGAQVGNGGYVMVLTSGSTVITKKLAIVR